MPELRYDRRLIHPQLFGLYLEGMLESDDFPRDETMAVLWEDPEDELAEKLLLELRSPDDSELLTGIYGAHRLISEERSEVIARSMLGALVKTADEDHAIFIESLPLRILFSCLQHIGGGKARDLLLEFMPKMGMNGLLAMGELLFDVEDVFGHLGDHEPGTRLPAPEGWELVEEAYTQSMARRAAGLSVFTYETSMVPMGIWMALDGASARKYLDDLFRNRDDVLECVITHLRTEHANTRKIRWHYRWKSGIGPQPARIVEVIESLVEDGSLERCQNERRHQIGALYLLMQAKEAGGDEDPVVSMEDVYGRLGRWSAGIK